MIVQGERLLSLVLMILVSVLAIGCSSAPATSTPMASTSALPSTSPTAFPTLSAWTPPTSAPSPTTVATSPAPSSTPTLLPGVTPNPYGQVSSIPSPDKRWTAVLDTRVGSLELQRAGGTTSTVFAPGSTADSVTWSPDGQTLLVIRANYYPLPSHTGYVFLGPMEIWRVRPEQNEKPMRLFQSPTDPKGNPGGADHIDFGQWSPDSRSVIFWLGSTSGSFQADGATLYALDVDVGKSTRLAQAALLNPRYQSWAPDSTGLVFASGGYRSAQVDKWLSLYDVKTDKVTTVVDQKEAVPGIVAWSPRGDLIAYAAVNASDTGEQWADYHAFDNPAILKRRVYLLDPKTGKHWQLNNVDAFQDAPTWSGDGTILYYVQSEGNDMVLMAANPSDGRGQVIEGSRRPAPGTVGYYGQTNWDDLLSFRPDVLPAPMPPLAETYVEHQTGLSIRYPAGWKVGVGWHHLIYGCSDCVTISPSAETDAPDYGPFSGQLFLSVENRVQTENDLEKLLTSLLASPGPGQLVNKGALLRVFDRHFTPVDGKAGVRLETIGELGEVNHMLVVVNSGRVIVLRGRGDARLFEALAASLHVP